MSRSRADADAAIPVKTQEGLRQREAHADTATLDNPAPCRRRRPLSSLSSPTRPATGSAAPPLFTKILIANRGEIACRVIRTARRMGIATVAVYSDADADARHVRLADEAVHIGPAPARESLPASATGSSPPRKATGAQAIHPGYGFLSENAAFAEACAAAGVVFIGPPASAIRAMGSKSAAKSLMEKAGVPLTPGYHGDDQDPALLRAAKPARIGYPVLIKATAGGGGKGMRRVDAAGDFAAALASCQREAKSAFGDDRVLVEQYVLQPRHIEIQVFADTHGDCVYLFERDCSVQRRHQKVLEEAPAPGMTRRAARGDGRGGGRGGAGGRLRRRRHGRVHRPSRRPLLLHGDEHAAAGRASGHRDDHRPRPGRVAAARRRRRAAAAARRTSSRSTATRSRRGSTPRTPTAASCPPPASWSTWCAPKEGDGVRVDTGVEQGDSITPFYDPMIAKLIVHGADRPAALAKMKAALAAYRIVGVANNVEFLGRLIATPSFANADARHGADRARARAAGAARGRPAGRRVHGRRLRRGRACRPRRAQRRRGAGRRRALALAPARRLAPQRPGLVADGLSRRRDRRRGRCRRAGEPGRWEFLSDGRRLRRRGPMDARGRDRGDGRRPADRRRGRAAGRQAPRLHRRPRASSCGYADPLGVAGAEHEEEGTGLLSPMPGKVIALLAAPGATVEKGAPLLVLEAMKMEHTISAPACRHGEVVPLRRRRPGRRRRRAGRVRLAAGGLESCYKTVVLT